MQTVNKLALLLGVALTTFAVFGAARADSIDDQILARLNALEKENAALRARITRIEASKPGTKQTRRVTVLDSAAPPPVLPPPVRGSPRTAASSREPCSRSPTTA